MPATLSNCDLLEVPSKEAFQIHASEWPEVDRAVCQCLWGGSLVNSASLPLWDHSCWQLVGTRLFYLVHQTFLIFKKTHNVIDQKAL